MARKKTWRQKNKARHSGSKTLIGLVVFSLVLVLGISSQSVVAKNEAYMKQEQELMKRLEEEQNRTLEIEEYAEYVKSDAYVEAIANEKLGLAYPNEIILVPTK